MLVLVTITSAMIIHAQFSAIKPPVLGFSAGMAAGIATVPPGGGSGLPCMEDTAASPLLFRQNSGRFVAVVAPSLFERDFVIHAEIAEGRVSTRGTDGNGSASSSPFPDPVLASEALRLRRAGDSIVLLEYAGLAGGQARYRRRTALPILRDSSSSTIVDAAPLWAAVRPRTGDGSEMWYRYAPESSSAGGAGRPLGVVADLPKIATVVQPWNGRLIRYHAGLLVLPAEPYRPRWRDPRVGFYPAGTNYIRRWRLEKKDPSARISDVVEPIIFRIAASVPAPWVPYFKRAVEQWIPVFESIGFRNAIMVRVPTETPAADEGQAPIGREAVLRWEWTKSSGASATAVADPRTGEVLRGMSRFNSGYVNNLRVIYFTRAGGADPRATVPFPDSLTGAMIERVMVHEVGHILGLMHNGRGGVGYATDSLRQPGFLRRMGPVASIMSYSFVNYVAQPEDHVEFQDLVARPGLYDYWTLGWGYRPIPDAASAEAERPTLERWRTAQDTAAYLRGSVDIPDGTGILPAVWQNIIGDDLVKSTEYGIRNLAHTAARLDPRQDTVKLSQSTMYSHIAKQWLRLLSITANVIGETVPQAPYPADLTQIRVRPLDSAYQLRAVRSIFAHAFSGESELLRHHVLPNSPSRPSGAIILFDTVTAGWDVQEWRQLQQTVLRRLIGGSLVRLGNQSPPVLRGLCQELNTLEQRLVAAEKLPMSSGQARALRDILGQRASGSC